MIETEEQWLEQKQQVRPWFISEEGGNLAIFKLGATVPSLLASERRYLYSRSEYPCSPNRKSIALYGVDQDGPHGCVQTRGKDGNEAL